MFQLYRRKNLDHDWLRLATVAWNEALKYGWPVSLLLIVYPELFEGWPNAEILLTNYIAYHPKYIVTKNAIPFFCLQQRLLIELKDIKILERGIKEIQHLQAASASGIIVTKSMLQDPIFLAASKFSTIRDSSLSLRSRKLVLLALKYNIMFPALLQQLCLTI